MPWKWLWLKSWKDKMSEKNLKIIDLSKPDVWEHRMAPKSIYSLRENNLKDHLKKKQKKKPG